MSIASVLRFQDYQFQVSLASGAWRWTTRVDVSGSQVATQIRDVVCPYGLLRDSTPIPGEVVQAMAKSIEQVVTSYAPSILLSPTTLSFVVDEGRGVSAPASVQVTNNGIFGSLLSAHVTSSTPFVSAVPASVGGLASNASGWFEVMVDSRELVASASPYGATLKVQSNTAGNSPQDIPVTVTVRPKATIAPTVTNLVFNVSAPLTGPFPPIPPQIFGLTNSGPAESILGYQIRRVVGASWIAGVSPFHGEISGEQTQPITVSVKPAEGTLPGTFTETLRVTGYSTNMSEDIVVTLNIS